MSNWAGGWVDHVAHEIGKEKIESGEREKETDVDGAHSIENGVSGGTGNGGLFREM